MAETKKVTLKRFNGTDYDTLRPETEWDQVQLKPTTFTPTAHTLNSHSDVNAPTPTDGYVLTWDSATARWIAAEGGGAVDSVNGQTGVVVLTASDVGAATSSHTHTFASLTSKPTTLSGYGITDAYTQTQVNSQISTAISNLVDSSPATLDTLNELAAALGDDPNFATTVATSIGTKADKTITISAGSGLTGGGDLSANRTISHADTSSQASVDNSGFTYIQDVTLDTYGHVTALGSATWSHPDTSTQASVNNSGATVIQDVTLDGAGHVTALGSTTLTAATVGAAASSHTHPYSDLTGTVPTWNQNTTGSAATLTTARTLTVGPTGKTFNGSANVTWSLAEIGINVVTSCPAAAGTAGRVNIYTGAKCNTKYSNWLYFETTT